MKKILILLGVIFLFGCAAMLPSVNEQYPEGHSKLVKSQPECQNTNLKNYSACLTAAELLELSSPEQVTTKFLAHWEETSFGMAARKQHAGETASVFDPGGGAVYGGVWGSVRRDEIRASEKIVLPTIKKIYSDADTEYSKKMLKQIDMVILDSKSSFDTFKEIHIELLKKTP